MARRIKHFGGQHETLPIKDKKQLDEFMFNLLRKRDRAKSPIKKYQADRNWMMCMLGFNTAFSRRSSPIKGNRCKKGICSYKRK
ncbi:MAG: hypothetical protein V8R64_16430 [Thomasclavelia sp.]